MAAPDERRVARILFVGHTAELGGAELCLLDTAPYFSGAVVCLFGDGPLVTALRARGARVELLAAARGALRVRRGSGVAAILRAVPATLRLAVALARRVRASDVVYANTQKSWVVTAFAALLARRPAIWHLHDILSADHFSSVLARAGVLLANRIAAAVIVNSAATGDAFVARGGRRALVRVIHNGIDFAPFDAVPDDARTTLRRSLRLADDALVVGLFGRITPWKGQHVLLDALRRLPRAHALLIGAPLFGEDAYLQELERSAQDSELAGRVTFLGFRRDVPELLRTVDVVVHASTAPEPFGRVLVEALLARRPVIATAAGGAAEIVTDGVDGVLVPRGDAAALAAAIADLAAAPERAARLVAAGRAQALDRFSRERMIAAVATVIDEVAPAAASSVCHGSALESRP